MSALEPETRYARNGEVSIAWQEHGDGPVDVLFVPGFISHLDHWWEVPAAERFFERIASFARLILFDKRGTGLSDPAEAPVPLEERMDDARAVMDAAGSERAIVIGLSEGGALATLLAAAHPDRVSSLILLYSTVCNRRHDDWPHGMTPESEARMREEMERWGDGAFAERWLGRTIAQDPRAVRQLSRFQRVSASPAIARRMMDMTLGIDAREVARTVRQRVLVIHASGDRMLPIAMARDMHGLFADAELREIDSDSHLPWLQGADEILDAIEQHVTGGHAAHEPERVLSTVLFSDVVDSTATAARLGDRGWRELLESLDRVVERQLGRHRGRAVKQLGDGHLAAFDGPARAVTCAKALVQGAGDLGLQLRCGIHTGECEVRGDDLAGLAVHIGARVGALAGPGEVLVSGTVKDLVVGSGLVFEDRGRHALKGVPGEWPIYSVSSSS